jgi:NAD(P)-dependent dehydrogenase (short-subunit alcohol dehydrogenase family)
VNKMSVKKWTFEDIPDLTGKTIIVTGGNSGLGYEAVKMFSRKNAEVILASRNLERGETAKETIKAEFPHVNIKIMKLDLADLGSVHDFANNFKKDHERLDILLNNAGIMWCPYNETKDGFEYQMGINHLGHFALTGLLLDPLKKTKGARVVNVSSLGHRNGKMNFENLLFEKGEYKPTQAYYNSKLANLLFTYELQRKFEEYDLDIISAAAHPGGSATNLMRYVEKKFWFRALKPLLYLMVQSASMGTLPEVRASVDPNVKGAEYYGPGGRREFKGYPVRVGSNGASHNKEDAKKLWEVSERLTKVKYNF